MEARIDRKSVRRRIRHRIRRRVGGTATRPRLAVFRSGRHIYAQAIDDQHGRTLAHASTLDPGIRERTSSNSATVEAAKLVGTTVAERLRETGVDSVTFDRGGFVFHGRVKALAEAAREAGLKF